MKQTNLNFPKDINQPPYNGQFWCHIRQSFQGWTDHINFYKAKKL